MSSSAQPSRKCMTETQTLETRGAEIVYDVHGPLSPAEGRPPLFMIGQPMTAGGFGDPGGALPRTHRGHVRPARPRPQHSRGRPRPTIDPADAGRGRARRDRGARRRPGRDVREQRRRGDRARARRCPPERRGDPRRARAAAHPRPPRRRGGPSAPRPASATPTRPAGCGAGMAAFIAMTSWRGEFTDEYFAQPAPDPAMFGMPTEDDGCARRPAALRPVVGDHQLPPRRRCARRRRRRAS